MRKNLSLTLLLTLAVFLIQAQPLKKKYPKPGNYTKRVTTVIGEKSRSYYSLNQTASSNIRVKGPGVLRVMTRARFVSGDQETLKYEMLYVVDGGQQQKVKNSGVKRSREAVYQNASLGKPGQLKDFEINLGRGDHTIEITLNDDSTPVAARYIFTPGKAKKREWIAYSPEQPSEPIDLISRETAVKYYRFSADKPLFVKVNGPTELRILSRIENHYNMKGRIHYRLQVKEGDDVLNTYQLSSLRSDIAAYKENSMLVPGKACEFVINVPKGRHNYEIVPLDRDKSTILGRCLLPKKAVRLRE